MPSSPTVLRSRVTNVSADSPRRCAAVLRAVWAKLNAKNPITSHHWYFSIHFSAVCNSDSNARAAIHTQRRRMAMPMESRERNRDRGI